MQIKNSLHWGHPGRDHMLQHVSDIWWPRIRSDVTLLAKSCPNCQQAGKSIKPILKQRKFGMIPTPEETNDEIAIDFAGPFKKARSSKQYLIVSNDSKTRWQDAKFYGRQPLAKYSNFYKDTWQITEFPNKLEQIRAQHSAVMHFVNFVINNS